MTITRERIVEEARTWLETPYRHQGRMKGVAVDCAGLVVGVLQALGLEVQDMEGYPRRPDGTLLAAVRAQTDAVEPGSQDLGDIAVFHWNFEHVHLGIMTGKTSVIHAFATNRMVVEHDLDARLLSTISSYRRVRGIA